MVSLNTSVAWIGLFPIIVSIYSRDNLGGLELISTAYQNDGSLGGPGLIRCVNQNVDMPG